MKSNLKQQLETAKFPQESQDLPAKSAYQNFGSRKRRLLSKTKYQNVGHSKNPLGETKETRRERGHQKQPHYLNTGQSWKEPRRETSDKTDTTAGKKLGKVSEYKNIGPHQHQTQKETTSHDARRPQGPDLQQAYQNVTSESKAVHRNDDEQTSSRLQAENPQQWLSAMGAIQSNEPNLSGYHATYDLLTHHLGNSDDQQSDSSISDYWAWKSTPYTCTLPYLHVRHHFQCYTICTLYM